MSPEPRETWLLEFGIDSPEGEPLRFAIDTRNVVEVVYDDLVTPLPEMFSPYVGVYDLRGVPVPVLDAGLRITGHRVPADGTARLVVCDIDGRLAGMRVARTFTHDAYPIARLLPLPASLSRAGWLLHSMIRKGDEYVYVLDTAALLDRVAGTALEGALLASPEQQVPRWTPQAGAA